MPSGWSHPVPSPRPPGKRVHARGPVPRCCPSTRRSPLCGPFAPKTAPPSRPPRSRPSPRSSAAFGRRSTPTSGGGRDSGRLFRAILPALLLADLSAGEPHGANLVLDFELLNPSRTFLGKYDDMWKEIDAPAARALPRVREMVGRLPFPRRRGDAPDRRGAVASPATRRGSSVAASPTSRPSARPASSSRATATTSRRRSRRAPRSPKPMPTSARSSCVAGGSSAGSTTRWATPASSSRPRPRRASTASSPRSLA